MRVEEIAARVWPGRRLTVEPLGGGITNRNFKVEVGGEAFVLRIGGRDTELLGIDRRAEHDASVAAAAAGVGPEVVAFVEPEGYLVTRFVEGEIVPVEEIRRPERLRELAGLLRRFHEGRPIASRFDAFRVVEQYRTTALAYGVAVPPAWDEAKAVADRIERARGRQPLRPCHNDLLNANLLDSPGGLVVVDWEYAGMGDAFFDLANFSVNHDLDGDESHELIAAYFGVASAEHVRSLTLMRFMSDFREAMWGVVQQGISELDFDFRAYAEEHFDRLARTAASPDFRSALG